MKKRKFVLTIIIITGILILLIICCNFYISRLNLLVTIEKESNNKDGKTDYILNKKINYTDYDNPTNNQTLTYITGVTPGDYIVNYQGLNIYIKVISIEGDVITIESTSDTKIVKSEIKLGDLVKINESELGLYLLDGPNTSYEYSINKGSLDKNYQSKRRYIENGKSITRDLLVTDDELHSDGMIRNIKKGLLSVTFELQNGNTWVKNRIFYSKQFDFRLDNDENCYSIKFEKEL